MSDKVDAQMRKETPGLLPEQIVLQRRQWTENHVVRRSLNIEAESLIQHIRVRMETCTPDELPKLQGQVIGIRAMQTKTNTQDQ